MRTTEHTEQHLPRIARLLGFESEPKWLTIRFAVSISVALDEQINMKEKIDFSNGKTYNLEVLTGKGKLDLTGDQADYNDLMALMIANRQDKQVKTEREFEKALEFHCERGFSILTSSLRDNSDIFGWTSQEFNPL